MTSCQQLLVLGVILAVLTPAARIVSIDFGPAPDGPLPAGAAGGVGGPGSAGGLPPLSMAAYTAVQSVPTLVPTAVVDPVVREVSLTAPTGAKSASGGLALAKSKVSAAGGQRVVSTPQRVTGYGAVGVTWQHGEAVPDDDITVKIRTRGGEDGGAGWSRWMKVDYHDDHGPDPDSDEARRARPGTDEMLVGEVAEVQVKVVTDRRAPSDMKLAVIDPGVPSSSAEELPALDTAELDGGTAEPPSRQADSSQQAPTQSTSDGDVELAAAAYTPKPVIYSRKQWGADERLRDGSPSYHEVHAGFVHHTVNANDYQPGDVPAILRGIYAYHTKSRGWSDIGYNYLVDKFGRIWEGRAGGIDRPVVGAHTLGYNDDAFAMSAIGNFETARPTNAMVQAYGALFGWKLSLHGVDASSTRQYVTSRTFMAINGHRDAASTACPGKYLYAQIPRIRKLAAEAQVGFGGRQLESNIVGADYPDLLVRRKSDGRGYVVPLRKQGNKVVRGTPIDTGIDLSTQNLLLNAGDWDRDGKVDMITRRTDTGTLYYRPGLGNGRFGEAVAIGTGFGRVRLLAAVGDMTGDGWPDLMGQPVGGDMRIYPGRGKRMVGRSYVAYSAVPAAKQIPVGLWDGDGAPDSLFRRRGTLVLYPGNGPGGLTGARSLEINVRGYNRIVGISDMDLNGKPDLLMRRAGTGQLVLFPGGSTTFGKPVELGYGYDVFDLFG